MPVVVLVAPPLTDSAADLAAASAVAVAIADALTLRAEDVYVTLSPTRMAVLGTKPVRPWPVVLIHGRRRATEAAALEAARAAAAAAWDAPLDEVWVQWVGADPVPRPGH